MILSDHYTAMTYPDRDIKGYSAITDIHLHWQLLARDLRLEN